MLELKANPVAAPSRGPLENKQPRQLVLALVLLLVALAGILIKDRQFWFGSNESLEADVTETEVHHQSVAKAVSGTSTQSIPAPAKKKTPAVTTSAEPKAPEAPAVATTRTVLPPLDVEVIAGDSHHTIRPGSNSTKVEITTGSASSPAFAAATTAAERERIAAAPAPASYPLLAKHMNVQGSVVLQAVIGADGIIQNLRVLNGPAILTSAAQQAVREWRFKPIMQDGQAVESKALITVNFTIKIADGSAKTTLAENQPLTIETLSR